MRTAHGGGRRCGQRGSRPVVRPLERFRDVEPRPQVHVVVHGDPLGGRVVAQADAGHQPGPVHAAAGLGLQIAVVIGGLERHLRATGFRVRAQFGDGLVGVLAAQPPPVDGGIQLADAIGQTAEGPLHEDTAQVGAGADRVDRDQPGRRARPSGRPVEDEDVLGSGHLRGVTTHPERRLPRGQRPQIELHQPRPLDLPDTGLVERRVRRRVHRPFHGGEIGRRRFARDRTEDGGTDDAEGRRLPATAQRASPADRVQDQDRRITP